MKKFVLIVLISCCSSFVFAQKVDTIKRWLGGVQMLSTNDVMQNLSQSKQFSIFVSLINKAGLTDSLKISGPITVFAPDNKAFENKGQAWMDTIEKPTNKIFLQAMIMAHVFKGVITSKQIAREIQQNKGFAMLNSSNGMIWAAKIDSNRNIVILYKNGQGNNVVSKFDIPQKNGALFVLNSVLGPEMDN
jgi:uncharacterized surface protein with fasciclin (FAS1) repeats